MPRDPAFLAAASDDVAEGRRAEGKKIGDCGGRASHPVRFGAASQVSHFGEAIGRLVHDRVRIVRGRERPAVADGRDQRDHHWSDPEPRIRDAVFAPQASAAATSGPIWPRPARSSSITLSARTSFPEEPLLVVIRQRDSKDQSGMCRRECDAADMRFFVFEEAL